MIGQIISHYKIIEKLGEGGMGVVYRAHDTKLDRDVALKFLPHSLAGDPVERERFFHEARAAAALTHPNIAVVYEFGEHDGRIFISMEYVEGRTMKALAASGPLPMNDVLDLAIQVCAGLAGAHERGIVHRDIKGDNIIVTPKGQAKITDFGLARLQGATRLTKTGSTLGTAAYMSPEQARGEETDRRSDIFSFGVVLYELLTGRLPFRGEHPSALMYSIVNEEPAPIARFNEKATPELERIVARALEKGKEVRYQHADDLLADLRREQKDPHASSSRGSAIRPSRPYLKHLLPASLVVAAVAALIILKPFHGNDGAQFPVREDRKSVAVLPFKNLSDEKENEYFSDGITEDIITRLSRIRDLRVISRTSIMRFKNSDKSLREIGKELGVATVLEGSVRKAGNEVRIVAQLIDAENDANLWGDTYDRELTKIFAIQSEVAERIAGALGAELSASEVSGLGQKSTENLNAYNSYLKGRYNWNTRTAEGLRKSLDYFQSAIDEDPAYALAYAGMAEAYTTLADWTFVEPADAYPKAKAMAEKALQIDETLAPAHAVLAQYKWSYEWDWEGAEREFRRAIEENANYATAHQWFAEYLAAMGRSDEAISHIRRAEELDPLSLIIGAIEGYIRYWARDYDGTIGQNRKILAMDSTFNPARMYIKWAYERKGLYDSAAAEWEKMSSVAGVRLTADQVRQVMDVYKRESMPGVHRWELIRLMEANKHRYVSPYYFAQLHALLHENDRAFDWLDRSLRGRSWGVPFIAVDPKLDGLRDDPRFADLLKRLSLEKVPSGRIPD
jgi:serine/threonine protein kinase